MSLATHSYSTVDQFRAAMAVEGIEIDDDLITDGKLHRYHVKGDRVGVKNAWALLHLDDSPVGQFGCNKRYGSHKFTWKADRATKPMSTAERKAQQAEWDRQKAERAEKKRQAEAAAAERACAIWKGAKLAADDHPYLVTKRIKAHGIRVGSWDLINQITGEVFTLTNNALLVPLQDKGRKVHSLQGIFPSKILGKGDAARNKDYLKDGVKQGMFYPIGKPQQHDGKLVYVVAEGFATAASIHEATGHAVLAAFDAGNLLAVADAIREGKPDAIIIVAADNDHWTTKPVANPGVHYARLAASSVRGLLAVPEFQPGAEGQPTDFNDLSVLEGPEAVAAVFDLVLKSQVPATAPAEVEPELRTELGNQAADDLDAALAEASAAPAIELEPVDEAVLPGSINLEPTPQQLPAVIGTVPAQASDDGEASGLGFIPLGTVGEAYAFWRQDTATVELVRSKDITSEAVILRLSSKQDWEAWCHGNSEKGKYDRSAIANMLVQVSKRIGHVDLSLVPESVAAPAAVNAAYVSAMLCARPSAGLLSQAMGANPEWQRAGVWFDVFRSEVVVNSAPPCGGTGGVWSDDYDALLSAWASMHWLIPANASMSSEAIMALARQNERHPVRDYLDGLEWDGTPRLDNWLVDITGCEDSIYSRAVGAKTLIGAVARVMRPGCKLDTMLVLEGRQGLRKSSLIEALVPSASWHSDSLGGDVGTKDAMASLSGKWVIELAELANLRGSDVNKIKHFISDPSDSYRPVYARRTRDFPRQCVFIGTINPDGDGSYLHDSTGGRRFWPVECTKVDIDRMRECRDQLWAEARARYEQGETWWLTEEQEGLASKAQQGRQEENTWVQRVARYLEQLPPTENGGTWGSKRAKRPEVVFTSDIFEAFTGRAYLRRDLVEGKNIGNALKSLGWESKNGPVNGVNCRYWRMRPDASEQPQPDTDDDSPF